MASPSLYPGDVLTWSKAVGLLVLCGLAQADTLHLKDQASITGQILAEKEDQVVIDVGYTVLSIPRSHVIRITRSEQTKRSGTAGDGGAISELGSTHPEPRPVDLESLPGGGAEMSQSGLYRAATVRAPEQSVRALMNQLGEAVVQVRTPSGQGSGFFLNEDGYLITNFHVIEGETQISIEVFQHKKGQLERRTYKTIRIVAMNKFADLALLEVEDSDAPRFATVVLGQADALAVGENVFAIGSPLGLERTVTQGIVSSKTRQIQGELYLQTTAQINQGNSGGPLFNLRGEVVGVINMKTAFGEGLGFAIPVDRLRFFLNNRDAFAYDNDNPSSAFRYLEPPRRIQKSAPEDAR